MTWRWLTAHAELAALAPAWDAAVAAADSDNPFLLSEFLLCWAESFVADGDLRVLAVFDNGRLAAGLPLYLSRRRRWPHLNVLRYLGIGFANLTEPLIAPGTESDFALVCGQALEELDGWQFCHLPLARSPWWRSLRAAHGGRYLEASAGAAARLLIDRPADAYVLTLRPKMQANLRRCRRLAQAAGGAMLSRETSSDAVAALIEFQLRHNGPDHYAPDVQVSPSRAAWADFTRRLLYRLAATARLDAMALHLGDHRAAAGFGFRHGPGYKSMLVSYDPAFSRFGPGLVFFHELIDWCHGQRDPWIDMYADGTSFDKRRWCHQFQPLYQARLFPQRWRSQPIYYICSSLVHS